MLKKIIITVLSVVLPFCASADVLRLADDAPKSYVVKKGDTLWDISETFLKSPWLWPKLWRINTEIENPHLIYPGDRLNLVFDANGQPMLVKGKPTIKLSPKVRTSLKQLNPIKTISLDIISPFVKYETILSEKEITESAYVLGNDDGYKSSVDGAKTYVNGHLTKGNGYAIYQKTDEIISPETKELIGYHATLVGTGKAINEGDTQKKEPATIYIQEAKREIRAGDIVKPVNEGQLLPAFFTMQAAEQHIRGKIVKASSGMREFGKFDVVFIDQGSHEGIKQGDVLSVARLSPGIVETNDGPVYSKGTSRWNRLASESNSDYKMPEELLGKMMVFKVFDQMSMAIILTSDKPLKLNDIIKAP